MHPLAEKISDPLAIELQNILNYWAKNSIDEVNDGFFVISSQVIY